MVSRSLVDADMDLLPATTNHFHAQVPIRSRPRRTRWLVSKLERRYLICQVLVANVRRCCYTLPTHRPDRQSSLSDSNTSEHSANPRSGGPSRLRSSSIRENEVPSDWPLCDRFGHTPSCHLRSPRRTRCLSCGRERPLQNPDLRARAGTAGRTPATRTQRTISTFSATAISALTAVCRSTLGPSRTTGSTIICPNIAVILSGQYAQGVLS